MYTVIISVIPLRHVPCNTLIRNVVSGVSAFRSSGRDHADRRRGATPQHRRQQLLLAASASAAPSKSTSLQKKATTTAAKDSNKLTAASGDKTHDNVKSCSRQDQNVSHETVSDKESSREQQQRPTQDNKPKRQHRVLLQQGIPTADVDSLSTG